MMSGMFGDYTRLERYEEYDDGDLMLVVSTIRAGDTDHEYETAVSGTNISPGRWVIVEEYDTIEQAGAGHLKWIETMTGDNSPKSLDDVSTCWLKKLESELMDCEVKT